MKKIIVILCCFILISCRDMVSDLTEFLGPQTHVIDSDLLVTCLETGEFTFPKAGIILSSVWEKTIKPFAINKFETSYELWYDVKEWAKTQGYVFLNEGVEGSASQSNTEPGLAKYKPVTTISWFDCILWCNAFSEKVGRKPVFYSDENYNDILKKYYITGSTTKNKIYIYSDTAANTDIQNCKANGYRLPTEAEWDFAARGGDSTKTDWKLAFSGSNDWTQVCVAETTEPKPCGSLFPNRLGIYDMSGNVWEFVFDYLSTTRHTLRGGSFGASSNSCKLSYMHFSEVDDDLAQSFFGFRIACSIIEE